MNEVNSTTKLPAQQGFDPEETFSGYFGLSMMRERAEAVGTLLSVTSQPGHGTELLIRWSQITSIPSVLH
jgi:nitrate/nitrite-specific signal transduction histidine kinase